MYQIKRCSGPCVGYIDENEYKKTVEDAIKFVSGKSRKIQKNLSEQMEKASEELDFEKAAILRDRIKSLNIIQSSQRINEANLVEADVIAGYKESGKTCVQVFFYRSKQNWGNQAFFPKHDPDESLKDIINSFVAQFYENKSVPKSIILSEDIKEKSLLEKTLSQKEKKDIKADEAKFNLKIDASAAEILASMTSTDSDSISAALSQMESNITELAEDYVELIEDLISKEGEARIVDIAKHLGISKATVNQTINRLVKKGFLTSKPYRAIHLTKKGKYTATHARQRHKIVYDFLIAIGLDKETAELDSEGTVSYTHLTLPTNREV